MPSQVDALMKKMSQLDGCLRRELDKLANQNAQLLCEVEQLRANQQRILKVLERAVTSTWSDKDLDKDSADEDYRPEQRSSKSKSISIRLRKRRRTTRRNLKETTEETSSLVKRKNGLQPDVEAQLESDNSNNDNDDVTNSTAPTGNEVDDETIVSPVVPGFDVSVHDVQFLSVGGLDRCGSRMVVDNYTFKPNRYRNHGTVYWSCTNSSCKCTAISVNGLLQGFGLNRKREINQIHDHPPDYVSLFRKKFRNEFISRYTYSAFPTTRVREIYDQLVGQVPADQRCNVPEYGPLAAAAGRARRLHTQPVTEKPADLALKEPFTETVDKEPFVLLDDISGEQRIIVFGTETAFRRVCTEQQLWMDSSQPALAPFQQLYTIQLVVTDTTFPVLFCFLSDVGRTIYERLFTCLKSKAASLNCLFQPQLVWTDLNVDLLNVLCSIEPVVIPKVTFYHLRKSIWSDFQGCQTELWGANFSMWLDKVMALPMLPDSLTWRAWHVLITKMPMIPNSQFEQLIQALDVKFFSSSAEIQSKFWSLYGCQYRTVNFSEGFAHRVCKAGAAGSSFWRLLEAIILRYKENLPHLMQQVSSASLEDLAAAKKRCSFQRVEERLRQLQLEYFGDMTVMYRVLSDNDLLNYLEAVADTLRQLKALPANRKPQTVSVNPATSSNVLLNLD